MPVTIHIQLLSGAVLSFRAPGRSGHVRLHRIKETMEKMVLHELELDPQHYTVTFHQEGDDEKREALRQLRMETVDNRYVSRPKSGPNYTYMNESARRALQEELESERTYEEGDKVYALVEERHDE